MFIVCIGVTLSLTFHILPLPRGDLCKANYLFNLNWDYLSLIKYSLYNDTIYPLIRWHKNNLNILFKVEKQLILGYIFETLHATSYYYCLQRQKKCRVP